MRIAILGSTGMLGSKVAKLLPDAICPKFDLSYPEEYPPLEADVIINCAGIIPIKCKRDVDMILVNSIAPRCLARLYRFAHIVNVSTDCVFSGDKGNYSVLDNPDARDTYGRSKALGEYQADNVTNVRTSFIGFKHGLIPFLLEHKGSGIQGWSNALWNGSTVGAVAEAIVKIALGCPVGLIHLTCPTALSKFNLLCYLDYLFGLDVVISPVREPITNHILMPTIPLPFITTREQELLDDFHSYDLLQP